MEVCGRAGVGQRQGLEDRQGGAGGWLASPEARSMDERWGWLPGDGDRNSILFEYDLSDGLQWWTPPCSGINGALSGVGGRGMPWGRSIPRTWGALGHCPPHGLVPQ